MATKPSSRPAYQIPPAARVVDRACDRFEASFRAGQGPRIEDYLAGVDRLLPEDLAPRALAAGNRAVFEGRPIAPTGALPGEVSTRGGDRRCRLHRGRPRPPHGTHAKNAARIEACTTDDRPLCDRRQDRGKPREVVYRVLHPELGREFVLKWARTTLATDPGSATSLTEEEAPIYRTGSSQPRPRRRGLGHHENHLHLVFENVPGLDLAEHAAQHRYTPRFAAALVADLASAVAYLHDRGLTHQEIQRRNILIDPTGRPRLMVSLPARFRNSAAPSSESDPTGLAALLHDLLIGHPIDRGATLPGPPNPRARPSRSRSNRSAFAPLPRPRDPVPRHRDLEKALRLHLRRRVKITGILAAFALLLLFAFLALIATLARSG